MTILVDEKVYPVQVSGPKDNVWLWQPELDLIVHGSSYDAAVWYLEEIVEGDLPRRVDPHALSRSYVGTHWYVRADRARVEIVREEWNAE